MTHTATKVRKQTEIAAATINRVTGKDGQFLGYLVKSNHSDNYYQVTWNGTGWDCNCASVRPCCHIKAVEAVMTAQHDVLVQAVAVVDQAEADYLRDQQEWASLSADEKAARRANIDLMFSPQYA